MPSFLVPSLFGYSNSAKMSYTGASLTICSRTWFLLCRSPHSGNRVCKPQLDSHHHHGHMQLYPQAPGHPLYITNQKDSNRENCSWWKRKNKAAYGLSPIPRCNKRVCIINWNVNWEKQDLLEPCRSKHVPVCLRRKTNKHWWSFSAPLLQKNPTIKGERGKITCIECFPIELSIL